MDKPRSCPSLAALEEHAAGRPLGKGHPDVEQHARACSRCREKLDALAREAGAFQHVLRSHVQEPQTPCPEHALLAAYLDNALEPDRRLEVEQHASACPRCRQTMANIHRDTKDIVSEREPAYMEEQPTPLTGRKRTKRTSKRSQLPAPDSADTDDAETRKKRLSSDFD